MAFSEDDTVEQALRKCLNTFQGDEKAADYAKLTEHVIEALRDNSRAKGVDGLINLQLQLGQARHMGQYVEEANMVEAITGNMRSSDSYSLQSMVPLLQSEKPDEFYEMLKVMQKTDLETRPYEFLNTAEEEDMTVNIKVPAGTQMKDVTVKLTATQIRVEVRGHEVQPCIFDGALFKPVDTSGCVNHLEGSGEKRILVLDLTKQTNGLKWPDLLCYGT
ncbi:unnamed protein product [Polarella glacialis]|uniref:CS domain-containing protein n=1 Tax=Polarella glacialis TaxID=89957 RepID=A0A813LTS2_POLGL|nr:unnamed protein product [Polarella glacialis]